MLMLDLFSGLGGASQAMKDRGWHVVRVDNDPSLRPDIVADIREWSWDGLRPDLIWASPPCEEFSREFMPWRRTGEEPDLSLVLAAKHIIDECQPRFWVIENVKGAVRWLNSILGPPRLVIGPYFLWGFFPDIGDVDTSEFPRKERMSSRCRRERAKIPYSLSQAFALACETQRSLLEVLS